MTTTITELRALAEWLTAQKRSKLAGTVRRALRELKATARLSAELASVKADRDERAKQKGEFFEEIERLRQELAVLRAASERGAGE